MLKDVAASDPHLRLPDSVAHVKPYPQEMIDRISVPAFRLDAMQFLTLSGHSHSMSRRLAKLQGNRALLELCAFLQTWTCAQHVCTQALRCLNM